MDVSLILKRDRDREKERKKRRERNNPLQEEPFDQSVIIERERER